MAKKLTIKKSRKNVNIRFAPSEADPQILIIFVDDTPWREVHRSIFGRKPGLLNKYGSLSELTEAFEENEYIAAKKYVFKQLAMKSQLSIELEKRLTERLVSHQTINRLIGECQQSGYINDTAWCESFIRQSMARRVGPQTILFKMRSKGISESIANQMIKQFDNPETQKEQITHLLNTRYQRRDLSIFHEKEKVIASLLRKGFNFSEIKEALRAYLLLR